MRKEDFRSFDLPYHHLSNRLCEDTQSIFWLNAKFIYLTISNSFVYLVPLTTIISILKKINILYLHLFIELITLFFILINNLTNLIKWISINTTSYQTYNWDIDHFNYYWKWNEITISSNYEFTARDRVNISISNCNHSNHGPVQRSYVYLRKICLIIKQLKPWI